MRFLLTGFEPFEGVRVNPTQQIVEHFRENSEYRGVSLDTLVFPVVLNAWDHVQELLKNDYDAMMHFGADPFNDYVRIERVGLNLDDFRIPDNEGLQVADQPIRGDGELAYMATLPVKAMAAALLDKGIEAKQSFTAGTYLCNHVMYESLYHVKKNGLTTLTGFIHMPLQDKIDIETQLKAVEIMLDVIIDQLEGMK
jgi:pyroglutamyl-peptidase